MTEEEKNKQNAALTPKELHGQFTPIREPLFESCALLDALFKSAPIGMGIWDKDLRCVYLNRALAGMNGTSIERHLGKRLDEVLPELDGIHDHMKSWRRIIKTGEPVFNVEVSGKTPAFIGEKRYWLENWYPVTVGNETIGLAATVVDITDRKRMEHELRESAERLRLAQIYAEFGIWDYAPRSDELYRTAELDQIQGIPPDTVKTYDDWRRLVHPDDLARIESDRDEALSRREPFDQEFRIRNRAGESRWINSKGRAIYDAAGEVVRIFGVNIDITERKRAEEVRRRKEEEYRALVENSPDVVVRLDRELRRTYVSPAIEAAIGCSPSEFLGSRIPEPEDAEPGEREHARVMGQACRRVFETGKEEVVEFSYPTSEGIKYFQGRLVPEFGQDGAIETVLTISRDITGRRQMEMALRESEERFRLATESFGGLIYEADIETGVVRRSSGLLALLGFGPDEVPGLSDWWWNRIHPDDLPEFKRVRADAFANRAPVMSSEYRIKHRNDNWMWVMDNSRIMYDESGRAARIVGCAISADDRKRAQELLQESEARLRRLFESDIIGIVYVNGDRITDANDVFLRMVGCSRDDLEAGGLSWRSMTAPEFISHDEDRMKELLEKGSIAPFEKECFRKDGSRISILIGATLLDRLHLEWACFVLDITERREMEKELRENRVDLELRVQQRTSELEKANEELRLIPVKMIAAQENERKRIAGDLHDSIGQTLAALKFQIEHVHVLLRKGEQKKARERIEILIPVFQHLIDETRAIYMGLTPKVLEDFGVVATLKWYRLEYLKLHPNQHIELDITIEEHDIPKSLKIPIFRITQEALNNISKHSKAEWVDLRLTSREGTVRLEVADDGIGMDPQSTVTSGPAMSLGLAGMKERAEMTGGEFSIESVPNEGTTVRAVWKISEADEAGATDGLFIAPREKRMGSAE